MYVEWTVTHSLCHAWAHAWQLSCTHHILRPLPPSWAEGDLVVAVAVARMGLGVISRVQVGVAAAGAPALQADARAAGEVHGQVVAVDYRDVVVVVAVAADDGELGQRRGRLPGEGAGVGTPAVAAVAVAPPAIEGAAGAAPDPAAGAGRRVECPRPPRVELRAAAHRDGRRPHREPAVVPDGEGCGAGACGEGSDDEEEEDPGWYHADPIVVYLASELVIRKSV